MDDTLDCWHKDLVGLASGQIAGEHKNQPAGFSCLSVDSVIGADHHGQVSFRASVKVICCQADRSVGATAVCGLGKSNAKKTQGSFWHWHSSLN
jgi:hypothetical protein